MKRKKNRKSPSPHTMPFPQLALKALLHYLRRKRGFSRYDSELFSEALGVPEDSLDELSSTHIQKMITERMKGHPRVRLADLLAEYPALGEFGDALGLSPVERGVLLLQVYVNSIRWWNNYANSVGTLSISEAESLIAHLLGRNRDEIHEALNPNGKLFTAGLLQPSQFSSRDLDTLYEPMDGMHEGLLRDTQDWERFLATRFQPTKLPETDLALDFGYLEDEINVIRQLLVGALEAGQKGIHVLLWGPPGTGKSTLAAQLSAQIASRTFSIRPSDKRGDDASGRERFRDYRLGQHLLGQDQRTLLLFDEMEDIFPSGMTFFFDSNMRATRKGWFNECLENATIPTIWTANNIWGVEKAHLRRFTYILEIPVPPRTTRMRLMKQALDQYDVSETWMRRVAESEGLVPSRIEQLGQLASFNATRGSDLEPMLESVLRNNLSAVDITLPRVRPSEELIPYSPSFANTDMDLEETARGLNGASEARLCFYGPPGTGKTAFARHLAERLDRPLMVKRASDLMSMWLGETEKNIAEMFRSAERENAVLLLDEADSFLRDRSGADRAWEVTLVNELLVQMENFQGFFIAATNMLTVLDAASLRRFDFKIAFEYLNLDQAWQIFAGICQANELPMEDANALKCQLGKLDNLAPGDFAAVIRKLSITECLSAQKIVQHLEKESQIKTAGKSRGIGFV